VRSACSASIYIIVWSFFQISNAWGGLHRSLLFAAMIDFLKQMIFIKKRKIQSEPASFVHVKDFPQHFSFQ